MNRIRRSVSALQLVFSTVLGAGTPVALIVIYDG
jgi:hypothetical protein